MQWVTATDLEQWAGTLASRHALSRLIADLVRASAKTITAYRFPTGDSSELPGYDGILEAEAVDPWVPGGKSVWEFGTGDDPKAKASSDHEKRTGNPGVGVVPGETTFVFVTPRRWRDPDDKARWIEERRGGPWAAVRVLDAVDLEAWLDANPAVAARLASLLHLLPQDGVRSATDFWDEYAAGTRPRLTEHVLVAGRQKETADLRVNFGQIPSRIVVRADSRDEALAFAIASVRTGDEEPRRFFESKSLVVDTDDVARRLRNRAGLIIGLRAPAGDSAGLLLERGNSVVFPQGNDAPNQREAIRLPRAPRNEFADALETMGLDDEQADRLARESGRSVTALFRRIPAVARRDPDWLGEAAYRDILVPAMLAGGWDSSSNGDRNAIATLASTAYEDFEVRLRPLLHVADPPVQQIGSVWMIVAPVDLFESVARYVGEANLDALKRTCINVLGEVDPAVELSPDERSYAALHGKVLGHSSWLRDGLTQTVLLIAVRGEFAGLVCARTPQDFANTVIKDLPGLAADHRLIASLERQLPLLMEAAPDPLLQALGRLLEGDGNRIAGLFKEGGLLVPSSYHTGLLWALESLAWDPKYFPEAVSTLVKLAKIDPGGKLANRPLNSLHEIFLPWLPSTNASLATRLGVLDSVLRDEPAIGWRLVASLLPSLHGVSMNTYKPRWREAGASEKETLTRRMVFDTYSAVIERVLALAGDDPDRWQKIISAMSAFDRASLEKMRDGLLSFSLRDQRAGVRFNVWSSLREEVNRHRRFASAQWALSPDELDRFDAIINTLQPTDIVEQHIWLFDKYHPELAQPYDKTKIDAADEPREQAIRAIAGQGGTEAVIRLAEQSKIPGLVGVAAADALSEDSLQELLERSLALGQRMDAFSSALSSRAIDRFGPIWVPWVLNGVGRGWTSDSVSTALSRWPDTLETWAAVAALGPEIEQKYWTRKPMFPLRDPDVLSTGATKYMEVGRATEALAAFAHDADKLPPVLLFELLDRTLDEIGAGKLPLSGNFSYELGEVFDTLTKRQDVDRAELARREYAYLPLLDHGERHLVLHDLLLSEPELFVQVLSDVYKAASEPAERDVTDNQSKRATMGYRLLQSLRKIPGVAPDGSIDDGALRTWISSVRELAARADRSEVADHQIGRILAYAPSDPSDGGWPHRVVRDLLEDLRSDAVDGAIVSEQLNIRGVYTKGVFEGGAQERGLAERARNWAQISQSRPRTARMLNHIAQMWEHHAKREDKDAERDKAKFA